MGWEMVDGDRSRMSWGPMKSGFLALPRVAELSLHCACLCKTLGPAALQVT